MPVLLRTSRQFAASLFLLLGIPAFCSGQAIVLVLALGTPKDAALSGVIEKAAIVQLGQNVAISPREGGTIQPAAGVAPASEATSGADFLLLISYSNAGNDIRLEDSLRNPDTAATLASYSTTVPFDLGFDVAVSNSVAKLMAMPGVEHAIEKAAEMRRSATLKAPSVTQQQSTSPNKGSTSGAVAGESQSRPVAGKSIAAAQPGASSQRPQWGFLLTGGAAPLILVGSASNYFRYGGSAALSARLRYPLKNLDLETGLMTVGAALFPAVGVSPGMVYSVLAGPQIHVGTSEKLPASIGVNAGGGAAIIIAYPAGSSLKAKTDLFASGAITAHLRIFRSFIVGTELSMLVVFEETYPIIAFQPTLKLGFSR